MSTSEYGEIRDLISRTFDELGGRATKQDMLAHLTIILPAHLTSYLVNRGMDRQIGDFFRSTGETGLPVAPEVDMHGTHVQLELLSVEEYRFAISRQMSNSRDARSRAVAYQQRCLDQHGVFIDVDDPLSGVA